MFTFTSILRQSVGRNVYPKDEFQQILDDLSTPRKPLHFLGFPESDEFVPDSGYLTPKPPWIPPPAKSTKRKLIDRNVDASGRNSTPINSARSYRKFNSCSRQQYKNYPQEESSVCMSYSETNVFKLSSNITECESALKLHTQMLVDTKQRCTSALINKGFVLRSNNKLVRSLKHSSPPQNEFRNSKTDGISVIQTKVNFHPMTKQNDDLAIMNFQHTVKVPLSRKGIMSKENTVDTEAVLQINGSAANESSLKKIRKVSPNSSTRKTNLRWPKTTTDFNNPPKLPIPIPSINKGTDIKVIKDISLIRSSKIPKLENIQEELYQRTEKDTIEDFFDEEISIKISPKVIKNIGFLSEGDEVLSARGIEIISTEIKKESFEKDTDGIEKKAPGVLNQEKVILPRYEETKKLENLERKLYEKAGNEIPNKKDDDSFKESGQDSTTGTRISKMALSSETEISKMQREVLKDPSIKRISSFTKSKLLKLHKTETEVHRETEEHGKVNDKNSGYDEGPVTSNIYPSRTDEVPEDKHKIMEAKSSEIHISKENSNQHLKSFKEENHMMKPMGSDKKLQVEDLNIRQVLKKLTQASEELKKSIDCIRRTMYDGTMEEEVNKLCAIVETQEETIRKLKRVSNTTLPFILSSSPYERDKFNANDGVKAIQIAKIANDTIDQYHFSVLDKLSAAYENKNEIRRLSRNHRNVVSCATSSVTQFWDSVADYASLFPGTSRLETPSTFSLPQTSSNQRCQQNSSRVMPDLTQPTTFECNDRKREITKIERSSILQGYSLESYGYSREGSMFGSQPDPRLKSWKSSSNISN